MRDDQDCENAVADQKEVNVNNASCLENPYSMVVNCEIPTQLGSPGNVMTARASFCRTATGSNSFHDNCDGTNDDVIEARVDSCLHSDSVHGTCSMLITGFCTDSTNAFDDRCNESAGNHRTGNTFVRTTLCANGATDGKCEAILGASFTAWADGDTADTGADILDAGAGTTDVNANFIKGVLNADGTLYLGKNPSDVNIIATTHVIRLNHDYTGDGASATPLRGDAEDGFVFAHADVADDGVSRFFVGILHTTDLGAPITDSRGRALWKGVIQAFRYDGDNSYIHNADFALSIDFDAGTLAFDGDNGVVTLLGAPTLRISITTGTFDKTTGLITGEVLFADNTVGSSKTSTAVLRGVIGREGAVGVFASPSTTETFGDFVGGFVASSVDDLSVCVSLIAAPFDDGCLRSDPAVLKAQFNACSTGRLGNGSSVKAADCNDVALSGVICSDSIGTSSNADPFAQICSDDAITIFNSAGMGFSAGVIDLDSDTIIDIDDVRQKVRAHCDITANSQDSVCVRREAQLTALSGRCVATDEPTLFGSLCASYREFSGARAALCRNRGDTTIATYNTYDCATKDIRAHICLASGEAGNPFDVGVCGDDGTYAEARQLFAARCARNVANDSIVTRALNGADCSGADQACLIDPFSDGAIGDSTCDMDEDYEDVRSDRITTCRDSDAVKYQTDSNLIDYECRSAVSNVCGNDQLASADPTDAALFNDKLCTDSSLYDTRRETIVADCAANKVTANPECEFEAATDINIISCIDEPYQVECAVAAFDVRRATGLSACNITTFVSQSATGVDCIEVQTSVCGAGVYAGDPFNPFCDKKDTANNDATIKPEILADGRNKYCQIGTNARDVAGCATFLARPTTAALLNAQTNKLDDTPNTEAAQNEFLRGTADGLSTGGFVQKDGFFAVVSTLNLSTATYEGSPLDGDVADGVAFFAGREHKVQGDITTDVDYYAGIHSGTDLGKPLPRQYNPAGGDLELEWNGRIGWLIYDPAQAGGYAFGTKTNGVRDFTLTINLTDRTIYALTARTADLYTAYGFLLEGDYDENGVINGTAQYGLRGGSGLSSALYQGFLIGLIGEQGAVGAFHLTENGAGGAAGGFVVSSSSLVGSDPAVPDEGSFNHWFANRNKDNADNPINVLGATEDINGTNPAANFIVGNDALTSFLAYDDEDNVLRFSAGSLDGVAYGFADVGGVEKFYTGLLVGTSLGAPLQQTSDSVTWNARLAIAKQDEQGTRTGSYLTSVDDFKLKISFTASGGTITTVNSQGITLTRAVSENPGAQDRFLISGTFNSQGLLRGTTTYRSFDGNNPADLGGILTGLIGVNGVAGTFISQASGAGTVGHYVGGFIASESFGRGGADDWQSNALAADGVAELTINEVGSAALADGTTSDYTFIGGGSDTLLLGNAATKSPTLTQDLTFDINLTLPNGDVFSLNSEVSGGISFAQATVGGQEQFYAGLLSDTFVGAPLQAQPASVNWRGVLSIITGASPVLYTTDFTLAVNFDTESVFSNTILPLAAGNTNHNIIIEGRFNADGIIYGTATYQTGGQSNEGILTGLIGTDGTAAVFGGDATSGAEAFIGGLIAVPSGASLLTPNSQFAWATELDETVFKDTRFNADIPTVITDANVINLDTTVLGGLDNVDGTQDGFTVFTTTVTVPTPATTRHVGITTGANLGGPVVDTGGIGQWHARMAGLIIGGGAATSFDADFTLRVVFNTQTITAGTMPSFVAADETQFSFSFPSVRWNVNTGVFTGDITLIASTGEPTKGGVLRGIIGRDGAIGTFKVSEAGAGGREFIGGFVAVPESIGAARGKTAYWTEYARNMDNTDALAVRGVRAARANDGDYTVIEGGLESLELGLAVTKHATLTHDLTFKDTVVLPDGSTISLDPTADGGISFARNAAVDKYYVGLLSGTDVGRLLSVQPTANWLGRLGFITGDKSYTPDFELAIDFDERTLTSFNPDDSTDRILLYTEAGSPFTLTIDGKFNDRGIIYGTTTYRFVISTTPASFDGVLTGLIGEKGAAAVFYSSTAIKYVGGFVAVPDLGPDFTNVRTNTTASYNVWTNRIPVAPVQDATSVAAGDTASTDNSAAFSTEIPTAPSAVNQISLNLATFGGDVGDGLIGYAGDAARHIGLLSSTNLGGVPIYAGKAEWSGVMQWILGDGSSDRFFTRSFTLNVDFNTQTLTADAITFTSDAVSYTLTLGLMPWDIDSGLITGTINIASSAQQSGGLVRGIIGGDGLVAAFRSNSTAASSFTGGFVAAEQKKSEVSFTEYFSSLTGDSMLQDSPAGATSKFAKTVGVEFVGSITGDVYRLGETSANTGDNPNGFVIANTTANRAVGILSTTDLGAPLPLTLAYEGTWTGRLYLRNVANSQNEEITLNVNFSAGTLVIKQPTTSDDFVTDSFSNKIRIDGYFGLNPRAIAANLPLGLLGGFVNYEVSGTVHPLALIGQIGEKGVVGIFTRAAEIAGGPILGGFTARSVGASADYREYNKISGVIANIDSIQLVFNNFAKANAAGNITGATRNHQFGLGGEDNSPITNPNGFTLGVGVITGQSENRIVTGIWGNADLGLLVPRTGASATWTGTVQTLKIGPRFNRVVGLTPDKSPFTIQVDFVNSQISTLGSDGQKGAVVLTNGDTLRFADTAFSPTSGVISPGGCPASCPIRYTIGGTEYGLSLIGLIGRKGVLGIFRGFLVNVNTGDLFRDTEAREHASGIVGGFEVTPTARAINPDVNIPAPDTLPKRLNYAAYLQYYQTDYVVTRHGPGVQVTPSTSATSGAILSQFVTSKADGTGINTGSNSLTFTSAESFNPFTVYLNGEGAATQNGFTLASGNRNVVIAIGGSFGSQVETHTYAGLLAGADVGRFSDDLTGATATWAGSFYSSAFVSGASAANRVPVRFAITLAVDFGAGTIGTGGDFALLQGHSVNIAGTFGFAKNDENQGILGGFITYTAPNDDVAKRVTRAPIYGIIGDAGALGVFAGGQYGVAGDGTDSPLVGGFEVSPKPAPTVGYQIFYNYTSTLAGSGGDPHGLLLRNTVTQGSSLLAGTVTGLTQVGIASNTCTGSNCIKRISYQTFRLGENRLSNSGFAFMEANTATKQRGFSYAGLLSSTNLGAVLPVSFANGATKAVWHGSFYSTTEFVLKTVGDTTVTEFVHHPLSLTVDLTAGTLQTVDLLGNLGAVALSTTSSLTIDGRFGLNPTTAKQTYGLLLGDVRYDTQDYKLVGLIGVEGAIGIFRTAAFFNPNVTIGGFQVSPPPPPAYARANYATFDNFYNRSKSSTDELHLLGSITADKAQFVRGTRTGLINHDLTGDLAAGSFAPLTVFLGGDVNSGNAFIIENFNGTYVAGLLGTTDLGTAPHEGLVSATWLGNFYVSSNVTGTGTDAPAPFVIKLGVEVDFGAGTLTSTQETYTLANTQFISFGIFGEFGQKQGLSLGILGGVVKYGHHASDAALIVTKELPLIGLIGREGALGVFRDPSDNNLVGGFEAGIGVNYDVFTDTVSTPTIEAGFNPYLSEFTNNNSAITRSDIFKVNEAGTDLVIAVLNPSNSDTIRTITGYNNVRYGLGDNTASINGFILGGGTLKTVRHPNRKVAGQHPAQVATDLRVVGVGLLPTANLGAVILDVRGSATWAGTAYVIDTIDDTTKVFELKFGLDFARGTFNTIGGTNGTIGVTRKIGADGATVTSGQTGQTLKITGLFGLGAVNQSGGYLHAGVVYYGNGVNPALQTNSLFGLIGRGGALGVFYGGSNNAGVNPGYAGGFWARPSAAATTVNYAAYLSHYRAEIKDSVNIPAEPSGRVEFFNGTTGATGGLVVQQNLTFRLGGDDADAANENGLRFNVFRNLKTVGLLGQTNLGAVLPNTTASATWYGRAFVKTDATAFNSDNERQISLDVDFAEGTIDTPAPVNFTIGTQTHSLSVRGRFGLHDFARRSFVPSATGLLSGFVEYTHHGALSAAKFDLIGLIGADGALGIFKGNVAGVGLIGGFEVTPPELETYLPNHTAYLEQFRGYINTRIMGEDNRSELAEGTATAVNRQGSNTPNYAATFRLRGVVDTQDDNYADGFAFIAFDGNRNKAVAILSGTDLGMPVTSNTESAIWAGQLVVNPAYTTATAKNSAVNLQVNFAAGTIETLQPITILAYEAGDPGVHKQSLEIKGIFGSHVDAFGLRTGTLGGTVEYTVGHYALDANLTNHTSSQRTLATKHRRVTARLPLRGLIGKEGAIGVFHGTVAGADFADVHVVGGFEVSPRAEITSTTVSFDRWARGATQCGAINLTVSTIDFDIECATRKAIIFAHPNDLFLSDEDFTGSNTKRQGFVLGNDVGIDLTRALSPTGAPTLKILDLGSDPSFNNQGERFLLSDNGGAATDGVAFIGDSFDNSIYAGLLSGTDLGAPLALNSALQVSWPGTLLYLVNGVPLDGGNFALTVDFANRGISWEAEASGGFILEGSYDEFGVITGIIKAKASLSSTGSVSGLIGVEGAVGAFVINTLDRFRVGGFVAAPVTKSKVTGYAHFSAHHGVLTGERELHDDLTTGDIAAFVVGTPTGLDNSTLTFGAGEFGSTAYKLGDDSASPSGFALLNGKFGADKRLRAGLLSGTDVGAVVSARVNGLWTGTANVAYTHSGTDANTFRSFALILDVDFAAGTIRTRTKALSGTDGLLISGVFGDNVDIDLPQGILGGEVTYQFQANGNDPENANLPLIGLIGGDGAIGVFTKTSGVFSYAGGFTAQPFILTDVGKVPAPAAVTVAQLQNFATLPTTGSATSGGFLKLGSTFTNTDVATFAPTDFTTNNATITLRNDIEDIGGVAYFSVTDGDDTKFYYYAGILSDTNLGAPVSNTDATMTWTGIFSEHGSRESPNKDDFVKFHVNFGAGTLQFSNAEETAGGATIVREGYTYTLNARFGHGAVDEYSNTILTTGQLGGQIKRSTGLMNDPDKFAPISGLIGKKGAVGAFVDSLDRSHFAGGFWAVPILGDEPDKNIRLVNFRDWSDSFGRGTPPPTTPTRLQNNNTESQFLTGNATVVSGKGLNEAGSISGVFGWRDRPLFPKLWQQYHA